MVVVMVVVMMLMFGMIRSCHRRNPSPSYFAFNSYSVPNSLPGLNIKLPKTLDFAPIED